MTQEEKQLQLVNFEKAKMLYKMANVNEKNMLENLFPELKEWGDERIRKKLVDLKMRNGLLKESN